MIKDGDVAAAMDIVNARTGGIDKPDTGIAFTLPVDEVYGLRQS